MSGKYNPTGTKSGRDCSKQRAAIEIDSELGEISDGDMGAKHGVSRFVAADVRRNKGIIPKKSNRRRIEPAVLKIKQHLEWLGVYYDTHIARELCIGTRSVQRFRRGLNISPGTEPLPDVKNMLLTSWMRPKGIDTLLEEIHSG